MDFEFVKLEEETEAEKMDFIENKIDSLEKTMAEMQNSIKQLEAHAQQQKNAFDHLINLCLETNTRVVALSKKLKTQPTSVKTVFPLYNMEDLTTLNHEIETDTEGYMNAIKKTIGSHNIKAGLKYILAENLTMQLNYRGMCGKRAFTDFDNLNNLLYEAVKTEDYSREQYRRDMCHAFKTIKIGHYKKKFLLKKKIDIK